MKFEINCRMYLAYDCKNQKPVGIFKELHDAKLAISLDRANNIPNYDDWDLVKRINYWSEFNKRISQHDNENIYYSFGEYRYKIHVIEF